MPDKVTIPVEIGREDLNRLWLLAWARGWDLQRGDDTALMQAVVRLALEVEQYGVPEDEHWAEMEAD